MIKSSKGTIQTLVALMLLQISLFAYADDSAKANTIVISNSNSQLVFSGEHAGMTFKGKFEQWQATLTLPPANFPSIQASFDLTSAKTGDWTYDSTLPESDWFDTKKHPNGTFTATQITPVDGGFEVTGELTLRGITQAVQFRLLGAIQEGFNAEIKINRLAFNIGLESDPDAEWVSREIVLDLTIPPQ